MLGEERVADDAIALAQRTSRSAGRRDRHPWPGYNDRSYKLELTLSAADLLHAVIKALPYRIHIVLTDNGTLFTTLGNVCSAAAEIKRAMQAGEPSRAYAFKYACAQADIGHRLTKPRHPYTNSQVERMNRTLKKATVNRHHMETLDHLRTHFSQFVATYNFAQRLKTLQGLTFYEFICKQRTSEP